MIAPNQSRNQRVAMISVGALVFMIVIIALAYNHLESFDLPVRCVYPGNVNKQQKIDPSPPPPPQPRQRPNRSATHHKHCAATDMDSLPDSPRKPTRPTTTRSSRHTSTRSTARASGPRTVGTSRSMASSTDSPRTRRGDGRSRSARGYASSIWTAGDLRTLGRSSM